ncbi:hypothetical protein ACFYTQ_17250 [Nocardia sp. NPDC004068]|uniref:hypothetical protein n=1 Tax=Nocardia sp. NPDC004068 TaxID=3364303 RepID=UPI003686CD91
MIIRAITAIAAAGGLSLAPAVVAPNASAANAAPCVFEFHTGRPYMHEPVSVIAGGAVYCPDPPERFIATLSLQYRLNGRWVLRNSDSSNRIPEPMQNLATWAHCEDGYWRAIVDMWETRDGEEKVHTEESNLALIEC